MRRCWKSNILPDESIGNISNSDDVKVSTLTSVITLPVTLDTFAFASVAPGKDSNTTLSPTWYPLPPVIIPTLSIVPTEADVISITSSYSLYGWVTYSYETLYCSYP